MTLYPTFQYMQKILFNHDFKYNWKYFIIRKNLIKKTLKVVLRAKKQKQYTIIG